MAIDTVKVRPPKRGRGPYRGGSHGHSDQTEGKRGAKRHSRGPRGHGTRRHARRTDR
jgi:hypothetical protein